MSIRSALVILAIAISWYVFPGLAAIAQVPDNVGYGVIWPSLPTNYKSANLYGMAFSTDANGNADYLFVVGSYERTDRNTVSGFFYDHFGYIDPAQPQKFWDIEEIVGPLPDTASSLRGANSQGLLSGNMRIGDGPRTGFFVDLSTTSELTPIAIPGFAPANSRTYWNVNELGDILFVGEIASGQKTPYLYNAYSDTYIQIPEVFASTHIWLNSSRQVVGFQGSNYRDVVVRHTVGVGSETFESLSWPSGINENGQVFATEHIDRGRNKGDYGVRINSNGQIVPLYDDQQFNLLMTGDPNDSGDVIRPYGDGRDYYSMYHEGDPLDANDGQFFDDIKDLIIVDSDLDYKLRNSALLVDGDRPNPYLSERDDTGFGWVAGLSVQGTNTDGSTRIELYILKPTIIASDPGIRVSPTDGLTTSESGGTDSFDVVLDSEPTADVTINISSSDTTEGTVNVTSLTFPSANWDTPQTVIMTGQNDPDIDGDIAYTIVTAAATSADPNYNGLDAADVFVTNLDDDSPPGGGTFDFPAPLESLPMSIQDRSTVRSTIVVPVSDDFQIANMTVNLDISHQRPSDLRVILIGPDGTEAPLSNFTGDNNVTAFNDDWTADTTWILEVSDVKKKKIGTLNGWSITVDTQ